jgi:hypothetical protein
MFGEVGSGAIDVSLDGHAESHENWYEKWFSPRPWPFLGPLAREAQVKL